MLICYLIIIAAISLNAASIWLFNYSHLKRKSADINCVLFEPTDIEIELEPTFVRKIGNGIRYQLYLIDLLTKAIRYKIKVVYNKIKEFFGLKSKDIFRHFLGFRRELWRKKKFFPSFSDWMYELKREYRLISRLPSAAGPGYRSPFEAVHLIGSMKLPKRVYVNDSCVVELSFLPELRYLSNVSPKLSIIRKEDGGFLIRAVWYKESKSLEIKLTGVGVNVTPIDPELQSEDSVFFSWGCAFPHSGIQTLVFRINLYYPSGNATSRIIHKVKVVQLDHLTSRQIRVFASFAAILGVISTILGILKAFNILM